MYIYSGPTEPSIWTSTSSLPINSRIHAEVVVDGAAVAVEDAARAAVDVVADAAVARVAAMRLPGVADQE